MAPPRNWILALSGAAALLLGGACSPAENEAGPGDVTASEAQALGDAAAMLESRSDDAATPPPGGTKPAER